MQEFNLREMIAKALDEMKQQGATAKQLKIYRSTGFGNALRYFDRSGVTDVSTDMLDDYLSKMHSDYLLGNYSEWKWRAVRRGKELLVNYVTCGSIDLKPLSPWDHDLGRATVCNCSWASSSFLSMVFRAIKKARISWYLIFVRYQQIQADKFVNVFLLFC